MMAYYNHIYIYITGSDWVISIFRYTHQILMVLRSLFTWFFFVVKTLPTWTTFPPTKKCRRKNNKHRGPSGHFSTVLFPSVDPLVPNGHQLGSLETWMTKRFQGHLGVESRNGWDVTRPKIFQGSFTGRNYTNHKCCVVSWYQKPKIMSGFVETVCTFLWGMLATPSFWVMFLKCCSSLIPSSQDELLRLKP